MELSLLICLVSVSGCTHLQPPSSINFPSHPSSSLIYRSFTSSRLESSNRLSLSLFSLLRLLLYINPFSFFSLSFLSSNGPRQWACPAILSSLLPPVSCLLRAASLPLLPVSLLNTPIASHCWLTVSSFYIRNYLLVYLFICVIYACKISGRNRLNLISRP